MAVAIGIWSLELTPGKVETVEPQADLRITNVALGDVLKDASGRTTVKFTYKGPPQIDSDDEDEDEDDENKDIARGSYTTVLCSLAPSTFEQTSTDIILQEEEEYTFEVVGKNTVYLTGNYIDQPSNNPPYMDSEDETDSDEDAYDLREVSSDVEMNPDDIISDASRFEDIDDAPKNLKRPREAEAEEEVTKPSKAAKKKKQKGEHGKAGEAAVAEKGQEPKKNTQEPKQQSKQELTEAKKAKPVEREITGGIKILDVTAGTGPMAKEGNTVRMRYIGKLQSGKVFDKNVKGKPFTFHLGKGEVIKGWDKGIVGMQVGGERVLTIPPAMGYGKNGTEGIPKNATLIFECKLLEIK